MSQTEMLYKWRIYHNYVSLQGLLNVPFLMGFYSDLMEFYSELMGFCSELMGVVKCPMTWVYWTSPEKVAI